MKNSSNAKNEYESFQNDLNKLSVILLEMMNILEKTLPLLETYENGPWLEARERVKEVMAKYKDAVNNIKVY